MLDVLHQPCKQRVTYMLEVAIGKLQCLLKTGQDLKGYCISLVGKRQGTGPAMNQIPESVNAILSVRSQT